MMSDNKPYIVSARKYRPSTFASVVGQESLTRTLKNAITSHRLAQAYLFCGPRGVGKTSCARIFARTINCLSPTADGEACGECASCRAFDEGNSFNIVELDAASNNSVDDIRTITEQVNVPPQSGNYRVFIIDEVHMLSNAAFNAFLKTLEEPPRYVVFILATTEKHKVIPTILSRCQIYDFKRITIDDMAGHLAHVAAGEGISAEPEALHVIAQKADGAMRDALSIFDQVAASSQGEITYASAVESLNVLDYDYYFRLVDCFRSGDVAEALMIYKEIRDKGFDSLFFVNGLGSHVRDLMVAADPRTIGLLEVGREVGERYVRQAQSMSKRWYYDAVKLLAECDLQYRVAGNKRLLVELLLIELCRLGGAVELAPAVAEAAAAEARPPVAARQAEQPVSSPRPAAERRQASPEEGRPASATVQPASAQPATMQPASVPSAGGQRQPTVKVPHVMAAGRQVSTRLGQRPHPADGSRKPDAAVSDEPSAAGAAHAAVSDETLQALWQEFLSVRGDLTILSTTMRTARPVKVGEPEIYGVEVDNPAQVQAFENSMGELVSWMRRKLGNDDFTLKVTVRDNTGVNRPLPPKEFIAKAVSGNEVIGRLLSDLDAEIV